MKAVLGIIVILGLVLTGCTEAIGTHEATIDGTPYQIVVAEKTTTEEPKEVEKTSNETTATAVTANFGGDYGIVEPPHNFTVRVDMPDGTIYLMKTGSIIVKGDATLTLFQYYVQHQGQGRWYFVDDSIKLPKAEAIIR